MLLGGGGGAKLMFDLGGAELMFDRGGADLMFDRGRRIGLKLRGSKFMFDRGPKLTYNEGAPN